MITPQEALALYDGAIAAREQARLYRVGKIPGIIEYHIRECALRGIATAVITSHITDAALSDCTEKEFDGIVGNLRFAGWTVDASSKMPERFIEIHIAGANP